MQAQLLPQICCTMVAPIRVPGDRDVLALELTSRQRMVVLEGRTGFSAVAGGVVAKTMERRLPAGHSRRSDDDA